MEREQVDSSNVRSVGYDKKLNILQVEFNSNAVYNYFEVPKKEYNDLMKAESHGSYLNSNIKGKYVYIRVV